MLVFIQHSSVVEKKGLVDKLKMANFIMNRKDPKVFHP